MTEAQILEYIKDPNIFGYAIVRPFGLIIMAIYNFVQNYGLTVILFALLVKLILIPLAIKGKKSMMAMNAMNAELQQLQKKYANNREKLNDEMQKLYEKHGVNPMLGCLPQFIPLPIMMGLYYAVEQPLQYILGLSKESVAALGQLVGIEKITNSYTVQIEIAEKLNQFIGSNGQFTSQVTSLSEEIKNLLVPIDFNFFGLNLAATPSFKDPSIMWIIPILSGVTAFLSSFVMQKMQGNNAQAGAAANQMKVMNAIMPLFSLYFGFILPGAIGIYWIFNNVFTCVQEVVLTKYFRNKQEKKETEAARLLAEEKATKKAANQAIQQQQQSQSAKNKKGDK